MSGIRFSYVVWCSTERVFFSLGVTGTSIEIAKVDEDLSVPGP